VRRVGVSTGELTGVGRLREERGLVGRAAVVLFVVVIVFGLLIVEGGSIVFARLQMSDLASATAVEGASAYRRSSSVPAAREAARAFAEDRDEDARITRFVVGADGAVTVTMRKKARTFIVQHVGFLEDLSVARATETAGPSSI
jgi:hypothetical protein